MSRMKKINFTKLFENLIGNYRVNINSEIIEENWNQSGIDEEILLTKQANNEQMK